jgi:hypothetical protein
MDVDDDVKPVIDALDKALDELKAAMEGHFDPAALNEDTIPEKLSINEQANFANVSAFALATLLYGWKKVNNISVDPQLLEKIIRVKEYAAKVKRNVDPIAGSSGRGAGEKTTTRAIRAKGKTSRPVDDVADVIERDTAATSKEAEATEAVPEPAEKRHRPQVDKAVVGRLTRL